MVIRHTLSSFGLFALLTFSITGCVAADDGSTLAPDQEATATALGREGDDPGWAATAPHALDENAGTVGVAEAKLSKGGSAALFGEARRELDHFNSGASHYSHSTRVHESTGVRDVDCSGFVDYALRYALPDAYARVPSSGVRPLAADWYHFLASRDSGPNGASSHWYRVTSVWDLRAGDLIAWQGSSDSASTGHMMMVYDTPSSGRSGEALVRVVDSAMSGHAHDSRGGGETGLGLGTIGLRVTAAGKPTGYYWRGGESTTLTTKTIALGRLE